MSRQGGKFLTVERTRRVRLVGTHRIKGDLYDVTYQVRLRRKKRRPDPAGPILNLDFERFAIYEKNGRTAGVVKLSETRWHFLKAISIEGEASFESIILAVPEWDVEFTDDGRIGAEASRTGEELEKAGIPFWIRTYSTIENGTKIQYAALEKGFRSEKDERKKRKPR